MNVIIMVNFKIISQHVRATLVVFPPLPWIFARVRWLIVMYAGDGTAPDSYSISHRSYLGFGCSRSKVQRGFGFAGALVVTADVVVYLMQRLFTHHKLVKRKG